MKAKKIVTPEKYVEKMIFGYLKSKGVFCWKNDSVGIFNPVKKIYMKSTNPNRINGTSDILGCLPDGRFLAIEVKSSAGTVSDEQTKFIDRVNLLGGMAFIARTVQDVKDYLEPKDADYLKP